MAHGERTAEQPTELGVSQRCEAATSAKGLDVPAAEGICAARQPEQQPERQSAQPDSWNAVREGRFSLAQAFSCAAAGVAHAVRTQRNMKIHLTVAVLAVALGFALRIDAPSWLAVIVCIALVIAMECVNTAIEAVVDLVSPGYAELARVAKDCAAGAVLVCAAGAVVVGAVVFLPRIAALLAG